MFMCLKPFYIHHIITKDIKMCVSKTHLHSRWSIKALIVNADKQNIQLGEVKDYNSFFDTIISECKEGETTYVKWMCTPTKTSLCEKISGKWNELKHHLLHHDDKTTTVPMQYFEGVPVTTNKEKVF